MAGKHPGNWKECLFLIQYGWPLGKSSGYLYWRGEGLTATGLEQDLGMDQPCLILELRSGCQGQALYSRNSCGTSGSWLLALPSPGLFFSHGSAKNQLQLEHPLSVPGFRSYLWCLLASALCSLHITIPHCSLHGLIFIKCLGSL